MPIFSIYDNFLFGHIYHHIHFIFWLRAIVDFSILCIQQTFKRANKLLARCQISFVWHLSNLA